MTSERRVALIANIENARRQLAKDPSVRRLRMATESALDALSELLTSPAKGELCGCGAAAETLHTCPYSEEISGDMVLCNCCAACQKNCSDDI